MEEVEPVDRRSVVDEALELGKWGGHGNIHGGEGFRSGLRGRTSTKTCRNEVEEDSTCA